MAGMYNLNDSYKNGLLLFLYFLIFYPTFRGQKDHSKAAYNI